MPFQKGNKICIDRIPWNKGLKGYNKDYPRNKSWRKRIGKALKKNKNGRGNKGRKILSQMGFQKGHKTFISKEGYKRIGERMKGKNNPLWKGGITPLMERIRKSYEYRQWRSDVFTRDDFTCQECGEKKDLESHHLKKFFTIIKEYKIKTLKEALACEELWNINNGQTLCKKCHKTKR